MLAGGLKGQDILPVRKELRTHSMTVSSPGMRGVAYKSMKVLFFYFQTHLDRVIIPNSVCYREVSIDLRESQQLNSTTGINADLKCSQQPLDNSWVALISRIHSLSGCGKLQ